jgi:hypothetical protein
VAVFAAACVAAPTASAASYSATETVPVPAASSYQGSGGGDGWAVALSPQDVFNVFHHSGELQVACHRQSDATPCWGPDTITDATDGNFATSGQPGLYFDQALGRLYVYATREADETGGVVCIDTAQAASNNDPFCGFTPLTPPGQAPLQSGISAISNPVVVGSRWPRVSGQPAEGCGYHLMPGHNPLNETRWVIAAMPLAREARMRTGW